MGLMLIVISLSEDRRLGKGATRVVKKLERWTNQ
jgi:hypothetical protein